MGTFGEQTASTPGRVQVVNHLPYLAPSVRITPQARYYAVGELCRRAGITREFFRTWKVSVTAQKTVFEISNGTQKFITFPHAGPNIIRNLASGHLSSVNVPLVERIVGSAGSHISRCAVPFVASEIAEDRPLFYLSDQNHLECSLDLPLSILLSLSRWEETLDSPRDTHGRFQAKHSITSIG